MNRRLTSTTGESGLGLLTLVAVLLMACSAPVTAAAANPPDRQSVRAPGCLATSWLAVVFLISAFSFLLSACAYAATLEDVTLPTNTIVTSTNPSPSTAAASALPGTLTMDALDDRHQLAIGDRLSFRIQEDEEDPKPLLVTDSGELEVPYIGRFPAENKTCRQLAREIKAKLEEEYYYQATVIIAVDLMAKSRGRVYLVGPVRMAGPQEIPSDEVLTLSKAILRAGGFGEFSNGRKVKVTRKPEPGGTDNRTYVIDVLEILEQGKTEKDLKLEPGDIILIPEKSIRW